MRPSPWVQVWRLRKLPRHWQQCLQLTRLANSCNLISSLRPCPWKGQLQSRNGNIPQQNCPRSTRNSCILIPSLRWPRPWKESYKSAREGTGCTRAEPWPARQQACNSRAIPAPAIAWKASLYGGPKEEHSAYQPTTAVAICQREN